MLNGLISHTCCFLQWQISVQIPNFGEILILQTEKKFTTISLKMNVTIVE